MTYRHQYRHQLLAMTAAVGLAAVPALGLAQGSSGSSMQPQATTQPGGPSTNPNARDGAPGNPASTGTQRAADSVTGQRTPADGTPGTAAGRAVDGITGGNRPDGTPGNPPGTAVGRAVDSVTGGNRPDGTPGNPPGTAAGRAVDSVTGGNRPDGTPGNPPGTAAGRAVDGTAGATTGAMAVDSASLRSGRRASKIIGATVYNENNESIGEVDDIMIPAVVGTPVAVISVGGFLGIGSKLVVVPYERLQMGGQGGNRWIMIGATKDSLTSLPVYSYESPATPRG